MIMESDVTQMNYSVKFKRHNSLPHTETKSAQMKTATVRSAARSWQATSCFIISARV